MIAEVLRPLRDRFDVVFDNTAYVPADLEPMIELLDGNVEQFVFTSSIAVYEPTAVQPLTEVSQRRPGAYNGSDRLLGYAAAKVRSEDALFERHDATGFPVTCLRVAHTLGPRSPNAPREHAVFARLEQRRPVLVPGEGFPFVHLVHIDDVARFMASLVGRTEARGEVYNVAGAEIASVTAYVILMADVVGTSAQIVHVPMDLARACSPPLVHWGEALSGGMVFDTSKARTELGWSPELGLAAGYADSYAWFRTGGRDTFELDFSNDDRILHSLEARDEERHDV